ncbi:ABC transporter substrate-binding protein [Paenibacillus sp. KS-LC4]|uniref:ABC transporter substrate-binding protein n=1 Tax=Paenibacillus sp. KS-LC4 TaxID=2979727 RepID=UPI0030D20B60
MRGIFSVKSTGKMTAILAAALIVTTACGNGGSSSSPTSTVGVDASPQAGATAEPTKNISLKVLMHASWYQAGMEAVVKDAATKGFDLQIEKVAEGEQGDNLIKTRFATQDKPDILMYYTGQAQISQLGDPADNFVLQDGQEWMKNFDAKAWTGAMDVDGKFYGGPYQGINAGVVLYNKKLFQSLNLQVPTTYDDLLKVSDTILKAGKTPVYFAGKDAWTLQLPAFQAVATPEYLGIVKGINDNTAKFGDLENFKNGLKQMDDLKSKGYINETFLSDTYDNAQKALATGEVGMFYMATWVMSDIAKKFPDQVNDIGAFMMPMEDGKSHLALFNPNSIYIVKGENQDAAQKFMNYFESIETQNIFFSNEGGIPAIKGVTETKLTPAELDSKTLVDEGKGVVNFGTGFKYSYGSPDSYIQDFMAGGKTIDQVMDAMQKEFVKNAKAKDDPKFQ